MTTPRKKIAAALTELTHAHGAPNTFFWHDLEPTGYLGSMTRTQHARAGNKIKTEAVPCAACGKGGNPLRILVDDYGWVECRYHRGAWRAVILRPKGGEA